MAQSCPPIARNLYGITMGLTSILGIALGLVVASTLGECSMLRALPVAVVLVFASGTMLIPLVGSALVPDAMWGMVVLGSSMARTMLSMIGMLIITTGLGVDRKAGVLGILCGVLVMMMAEAAIAVWLLNKREAARKDRLEQLSTADSGLMASSSGSLT